MAPPKNTAGIVNRSMPVRTLVAVNGSAGAYVLVSATIPCGYLEIMECPAGAYAGGVFTGQGCNYQRADENYAVTYPLVPGQILQLGDAIRKNRNEGMPARTDADGSARPATPYIKIISATVTATAVSLQEWRQLESA